MELLDVKGKVETAFKRVLQPYVDSGDLSLFQIVWRFFTGNLRARRISIVCGSTEIALRDEDGSPLLWEVPVILEICSNLKDNTTPHDDYVAIVADATYGGSAFVDQLNEAMQGEQFKAWHWESDASRDDEVDGNIAKTRIVGTLHLQPWG
jgi:hypothetical protein